MHTPHLISSTLLCLAFGALGQTSSAQAPYPGYTAHLTQRGLSYGAETGGEAIQRLLMSTRFPTYTLNEKNFAYLTLGNITFKSFDHPEWFYGLTPPSAITYGMTGASIDIQGDFSALIRPYVFRNVSISGKLEATASSVSLALTIGLGMDTAGRPTVRADNCDVQVSGFDVKLTGSLWAYILDIFHKQIAEDIQKEINTALCSAATTLINDKVSKTIAKLVPSPVPIEKTGFAFDYHLLSIQANTTGSKRVDITGVGGVCYQGHYSGPSRNPNPLDIPSSMTSSMGYIFVSDFAVQSALSAAMGAGVLQFSLNQETVPAAKNFLKTKCPGSLCLGSLIKELGDDYPNSTCQVDLLATLSPFANFDKTGAHIGVEKLQIALGIYNSSSPGTPRHFALATANASVTLTPEVYPEKINGTGKITDLSLAQVYSTLKSKINWVFIENYLKYYAGTKLTKILKKGYTFPYLEGVSFVDPDVQMQQHTLQVSTDISYTPTM